MTSTTLRRSDFGALRAIRAGSGPRLLFLHGVGLQAEAWRGQIEVLSTDFDVTAPDMPGHGDSPMLTDPATLNAYTDQVARALDRPSLVVGHSMGAMIALDLAIRYPDKVMGVAALNAIYRRSKEASAAVQKRADHLDGQSPSDPTGTLERWFGNATSPESAACREWLTDVDPRGYQAAYRVFATEDGPSDAGLAGLHCPALFCTGDNEPNSTPEMSRRMANLVPQGQARIVAGAAHMMPMTHAPKINSILRAFFEDRCL